MKVALAQINPTIGDFRGNCEKIVRAAIRARGEGADLTVFSELCVLGYPAQDLLEKPAFLDAHDRALAQLKKALKGLPAIIGFVERREEKSGRPLYNACALVENGEFKAVARKCLLPTYDVFDEDRYFEPGKGVTCVDFEGYRLGLTICEDVWNDKDFWQTTRYSRDPVEELISDGAELIINISASPFGIGKQIVKETMLSSLSRKYRRPLLYVNQVGGNTELIFDGRSLAFATNGKLIGRGAAFKEDLNIVDLEYFEAEVSPRLSEEEEIRQALVLGTRDYANKCGFDGGIIGLSGGIDSTVVGALAAEAFGPQNLMGVAMPSRFNAPESLRDARELADRLGIGFYNLPIQEPFTSFKQLLGPVFAGRPEDVTEENLQARIRGTILMALSNKFGMLVLTTGNKSEVATGYCTLYGDMCGGLSVISDLYKTSVFKLARHINADSDRPPIPERCITRAPSAELRENQKDEDSLPPYDVLDGILKAYIEDHRTLSQIATLGFDFEIARRIIRLVDFNEYKRRQAAPGLKLTAKAFGSGRRMPIAQRFREGD